jgi:antitoxin MazE
MRIKVIDIGNSKGIRLPQALIQQYNLENEVTVELTKEGIMLSSIHKARAGWEEQFKQATGKITAEEKNWMGSGNKFDKEEWTW